VVSDPKVVGLGWVYAITDVQPFGVRFFIRKCVVFACFVSSDVDKTCKALVDGLYAVWAKLRLPLTGREDLATIVAKKETCKSSSQ